MESERGMSPTMSLVIGIIIGSFTAMILIVIIVLKVRTGVDLSEIKQVGVEVKILSKSGLNLILMTSGGNAKIPISFSICWRRRGVPAL